MSALSKLEHRSHITLSEASLVERSEDGLPLAFRIWKYGVNETSCGPDVFDERSAELLIKQQEERRGLKWAFDYDHLSIFSDKPESRKAAGFHDLEVREDVFGKPELWAVNCEWTRSARDALMQEPPEFRYFSPTFYADDERRIVAYCNCALTNDPATYGIPSLRSNKQNGGNTMDIEQLAAILGLEGDSKNEFIAAFSGKTPEEIKEALLSFSKKEEPSTSDVTATEETRSDSSEEEEKSEASEEKRSAQGAIKGFSKEQIRTLESVISRSMKAPARRNEAPSVPQKSAVGNASLSAIVGTEQYRSARERVGLDGQIHDFKNIKLVNADAFLIRHSADRQCIERIQTIQKGRGY